MNQYINFYWHRACCQTSFIHCLIVTAQNLIWPIYIYIYITSISSWDSSPWQVLYIQLFCFICVFFNYLLCSACILQMRDKPNQFLIEVKVYFFIIIYSLIYLFFFFRLSNFSHMKRLRLVDYFVCLFCFLSWNCRVIIHNFITFLSFSKDLQCSSFIFILT